MPNSYASYAYATEEYAGPPVPNSPYVETNGGLFPYTIVEVGFGNGPNDANPTWVNVAADVTQVSTRRGRQRILGRFEPGTATITLDNTSGRYSPFNSSSPYYNQVRLGMPVRFRAIWGAVTYTVFYGFVETWPLTWPSANTSTLSVTAVDAMKWLNLKKATSINFYSAVVGADAPLAWWRCNDAAESTTLADSSGHANTATVNTGDPGIPRSGTWHLQAESLLTADPSASLDLGYHDLLFHGPLGVTLDATNSFTFECWAEPRVSDPEYFVEAQSGAASGFSLWFDGTNIVWEGPFSPQVIGPSSMSGPLHLVGTCGGSTPTLTLYLNGELVGQQQSISGPGWAGSFNFVRIGGTFGVTYDNPWGSGIIQEVAAYNYALTAAQVRAHYRAGVTPRHDEATGTRIAYLAGYTSIPPAMQVIDTGLSTVQGATDKWLTGTILANMADQADSEGGDLFIDAAGRLTFFDRAHTARSPYSQVSLVLGDTGTPPEEPYRLDSLTVSYDDQDVYNEVTITPDGMSPQTASDATSQSNYGKRTLPKDSLTASVADAAAQAAAQLAIFKTPLPRIDSVTVNPADDPTMLFGPVLGFDLLTRVEVRRRPKDGAGSTFDQVALLEGIEHKVTKATWETTWRMSSTDAI